MKKVLIFDDDTDIWELCSLILKVKGYHTIGETTCVNVIDKVRTTNPDVILMDNWIPDIGGIAATQLLKRDPATKHIPVIFFTANNNVEKLSQEAGADYFLEKPFDLNHFVGMVSKAMGQPVNNNSEILTKKR